jgi:N-methylhydantoinase A/oxoprolinase/acetone carboxylase beta subunit
MSADVSFRIAIDIGGTFTDGVALSSSGRRITAKSLTTSGDPSRGVIDCLKIIALMLDTSLTDLVSRTVTFVHGTTVGTNALVERRGARTGLLMTRGHEQAITIGRVRQKVTGLSEREKIHVTHLNKADPPIIRHEDIRSVTERIDAYGEVIVALDLAQVERSLDDLVASGIESLAVCLLWSFLAPAHEEQIRDLARRKYPHLFISISSEIAPRTGEYERCVSTAFNSYIGPIVGDYLTKLEQRLTALGMPCSLLVVQSNGGLSTVRSMLGRPLVIIDSGPAGGVLGARFHTNFLAEKNILCADVGGTTFDVGLAFADRVQMDNSPVVDRYAYLIPKIYVKSIGAGGGSIAWLDAAGSLRVGPQSAGSVPGPVSYGRGGTQPTVTDALVVLGYLDPDFPLGGHVRLDREAAERALSELGAKVNMSAVDLAAGIVKILNSQMADLARKVTVERGLDPRSFVLFGYGGAGPVFSAFLMRELGSRKAYIPADSGVFSAFGMLTTDIVFQEERSTNLRSPLVQKDVDSINLLYDDLAKRVLRRFDATALDVGLVELKRSIDMRFGMQVHELDVDVKDGVLSLPDMEEIVRSFISKYEATYGQDSAYIAAGIEFVTFRVTGTIVMDRPKLAALERVREQQESLTTRRRCYFAPQGYTDTEFHAGDRVVADQIISGPAIIQRSGDTVVLPPGTRADADHHGGLTITWTEARL